MIKNLREMLYRSAENYGDRIAYKIRDGKNAYKLYTYTDVKNMVNALGTKFIDMGLKNKRIAIISENRFEWEVSYFSVVCGTGIVVPIDKALPYNELCSVIERSEAEVVVFSEKYTEDFLKIKELNNKLQYLVCMESVEREGVLNFTNLIEDGEKLLEKGDTRFLDAEIDSEIMNMMLFTSGTTADSKIVALSHRNLCANLLDLEKTLDIDCNDVFLSVLPIHHVFECMAGFLLPLYNGAQITFCDGIRHVAENLKEYEVTVVSCVPGIYEAIFKSIKLILAKLGKLDDFLNNQDKYRKMSMEERKEAFIEIHQFFGNKLKLMISGAAALDKNVEDSYRLLGFNIIQGYGLTETSPVIAVANNEFHKVGSVGKKLPSLDVDVIEPNEYGIGELIVKGPSVMIEYFGNKEATDEVLNDGWFKTGDLVRIDEEGYIFICGRKKNVIVLKNGKNIYPEEMEALINKIDGVEESMIFGDQKSDDENDIKINVIIVVNKKFFDENYFAGETLNDEEFNKRAKDIVREKVKEINQMMPKYKAIRDIIITVNPLIKTTTNKVKRQANLDAIRSAK